MEQTGSRHDVISGVLMGMEEQLLMIIEVLSVFPYSDINLVLSSICFHSLFPLLFEFLLCARPCPEQECPMAGIPLPSQSSGGQKV